MKKTSKTFLFILSILYTYSTFAAEIEACQDAECVSYFKKYKKYVRAGQAEAMVTLGEFYYHGYGTDKDIKQALKLFRRAAKYGSVFGQSKAGLLYLTFPEVKDIDEGIIHLKEAARNKHGESAYLLGTIFYSQDLGRQDLSEADKWLTNAYNSGHKKVKEFIVHISQSKNFTEKNFPQLIELIEEISMEYNISTDKVTTQLASLESSQQQDENINWPQDEMEVITVSPPTLMEIFDDELSSIKNTLPEKYNIGTGSHIIGQTCERNLICNTTSKKGFKRKLNALDGT